MLFWISLQLVYCLAKLPTSCLVPKKDIFSYKAWCQIHVTKTMHVFMWLVVPVVPYLLYIVYIEYIVTVLTESRYIYMNDSPVIQVYPCIEFLKVHCISICIILFCRLIFKFLSFITIFTCSYFISFNKLNGFFIVTLKLFTRAIGLIFINYT